MNYRFIHAADLHLDTPFEGIGRIGGGITEHMREASLQAFDNLVDLAVDEEAAFILLAGDIYDGSQRGIRAQLRFRRGMEELAARKIQVFIVHGNHDPLEGWSAIRSWPENVTIFGSDEVGVQNVVRDGQTLAHIYGISYERRDVQENLALRFKRGKGGGLHIGLLHCNAGHNSDHAPYSPCSIEELQKTKIDYWALGHIHRRQILQETSPCIVYSGNVQGRSPKPAEQGAKGAYVVEVQDGRLARLRFAPLDCIRFVPVSLDVSGLQDVGELQDALLSRASELHQENGQRGLILRPLLKGEAAMYHDLRRRDCIEQLLRDVRDVSGKRFGNVWWEEPRILCRPELDLDAIKRRDDFSSAVLQRLEALVVDGELQEEMAGEALEAIMQAGYLDKLSPDVLRQLVQESGTLALSMLEGGYTDAD